MRHLLVTNDFPPKIGGIQSYLWELWRRLPPEEVTVLTTPRSGSELFDRAQPFRIVRSREPVLLPNPLLGDRIRRLASEVGARAVVLDPALPLGLIGPSLQLPYAVVLHGAEVAVPGRIPAGRQLLARVLRGADLWIAAGSYPEAEARRALGAGASKAPKKGSVVGSSLPIVQVPPGVDTRRFVPLPSIERAASRARLSLPVDAQLVLSVSRLVPRKGMDVLISAVGALARSHPKLVLAIAGAGRDRARLEYHARRSGAAIRFLGRVAEADLPGLYACSDVFVLACRSRWGGLEQEGFGIVLLEAAASGVPVVVGRSGGAADAVAHGETGEVVEHPNDVAAFAGAIARLVDNPSLAKRQGMAARSRAEREFAYDVLAERLGTAIETLGTPARW